MGLYNAFNGLGLGQAALNAQQIGYNNRKSAYDQLANGLEALFASRAQKEEDERLRQQEAQKRASALEYLSGTGMDPKQAEALVDSVGSKEMAQLMFNKGISDEEYARGRKDSLEDRDAAWKREDEAHARDRGESALDAGFSKLSDAYLAQLTKFRDGMPSRMDVEEYNRVYGALKEFVTAHPEYGVKLDELMLQGANGGKGVVTSDDWLDKVKALEVDGAVDPEAMYALKQEMIEQGAFDKFLEDEGRKRIWLDRESKQKGSKLKRDKQNLGAGGVKTQEDAGKELDKAEESARLAKLAKSLNAWYTGKGPMPDISEKDLAKLNKKQVAEYRRRKRKK